MFRGIGQYRTLQSHTVTEPPTRTSGLPRHSILLRHFVQAAKPDHAKSMASLEATEGLDTMTDAHHMTSLEPSPHRPESRCLVPVIERPLEKVVSAVHDA